MSVFETKIVQFIRSNLTKITVKHQQRIYDQYSTTCKSIQRELEGFLHAVNYKNEFWIQLRVYVDALQSYFSSKKITQLSKVAPDRCLAPECIDFLREILNIFFSVMDYSLWAKEGRFISTMISDGPETFNQFVQKLKRTRLINEEEVMWFHNNWQIKRAQSCRYATGRKRRNSQASYIQTNHINYANHTNYRNRGNHSNRISNNSHNNINRVNYQHQNIYNTHNAQTAQNAHNINDDNCHPYQLQSQSNLLYLAQPKCHNVVHGEGINKVAHVNRNSNVHKNSNLQARINACPITNAHIHDSDNNANTSPSPNHAQAHSNIQVRSHIQLQSHPQDQSHSSIGNQISILNPTTIQNRNDTVELDSILSTTPNSITGTIIPPPPQTNIIQIRKEGNSEISNSEGGTSNFPSSAPCSSSNNMLSSTSKKLDDGYSWKNHSKQLGSSPLQSVKYSHVYQKLESSIQPSVTASIQLSSDEISDSFLRSKIGMEFHQQMVDRSLVHPFMKCSVQPSTKHHIPTIPSSIKSLEPSVKPIQPIESVQLLTSTSQPCKFQSLEELETSLNNQDHQQTQETNAVDRLHNLDLLGALQTTESCKACQPSSETLDTSLEVKLSSQPNLSPPLSSTQSVMPNNMNDYQNVMGSDTSISLNSSNPSATSNTLVLSDSTHSSQLSKSSMVSQGPLTEISNLYSNISNIELETQNSLRSNNTAYTNSITNYLPQDKLPSGQDIGLSTQAQQQLQFVQELGENVPRMNHPQVLQHGKKNQKGKRVKKREKKTFYTNQNFYELQLAHNQGHSRNTPNTSSSYASKTNNLTFSTAKEAGALKYIISSQPNSKSDNSKPKDKHKKRVRRNADRVYIETNGQQNQKIIRNAQGNPIGVQNATMLRHPNYPYIFYPSNPRIYDMRGYHNRMIPRNAYSLANPNTQNPWFGVDSQFGSFGHVPDIILGISPQNTTIENLNNPLFYNDYSSDYPSDEDSLNRSTSSDDVEFIV